MDLIWLKLALAITLLGIVGGQEGNIQTPVTCDPSPCTQTQYCEIVTITQGQNQTVCKNCDESCDGCTGRFHTDCIACRQPGYLRGSNGECNACNKLRFGDNCTGTCHCLQGAADCDVKTGNCKSFQCEWGWQEVPDCQTPCDNTTFDVNCERTCHCPPGDGCSPINGLCYGGYCGAGWSGAGCQNQLPMLTDPPSVEKVSCDNVTVTWPRWRAGVDMVGSAGITIARYELYYELENSVSGWLLVPNGEIQHRSDQDDYSITLNSLQPDVSYRFRVDVRQQDGDKLMTSIAAGKPSPFVLIPCTVTTVQPKPGTTAAPPGPLLGRPLLLSMKDDTTIHVQWNVLNNASSMELNVTLAYYISHIGDCQTVTDPKVTTIDIDESTGNYNITNVLPWRQYVVQVTAVSQKTNLTDIVDSNIATAETAPSAPVPDIRVTSVTKDGGTVTWSPLPCPEQGGVLANYTVTVVGLPGQVPLLEARTNETRYVISTLQPFSDYGVIVVFVNSVGESLLPNLTKFITAEDVPGMPTITSVSADRTSVTVTLTPPKVTNGNLIDYTVSIDTTDNFTSAISKVQPVIQGTTITMANLASYTVYYIRVHARTEAGAGPASDSSSIRTEGDVPDPPTHVTSDPAIRNETCMMITWSEPEMPNGVITGYNVSYYETAAGSGTRSTVSTMTTRALICSLASGRFYEIEVIASTSFGFGPPSRLQTSTEQATPPAPPAPTVINTTFTSVAVTLDPVVATSPTLTYSYLLFIDDVTQDVINAGTRRKRATGTGSQTCPDVSDVPGYVARNFSQGELITRTEFIIGTNVVHGDYRNVPLVDGHYYDIYYVITSYFQDICKYSYAKTAKPVKAVTVTSPASESDDTETILIIVIVVIGLLVVIAIVVVVIICCCRNRGAEQKYAPYYNEADNYDLKVYKIDDYDSHRYWNTIYSLRESRYIIVGRDYLQDDRHLNGSAVVKTTTPPITFHTEFENLPHGRLSSCNVAKLRDNIDKNRFSHLLPYDHSRVILDDDGLLQNNYINANFINGYRHQRAYIAAQSPFNEDTVLDFWRMIYQYEVKVVVMMSNIVEDNIVKCTQYWPDSDRAIYGQFVLDLVNVDEYADYCIRTIKVRTKADTDWQLVYIFDYNSWPEHGVPDDAIPLLEMRNKVNTYNNNGVAPIVVHCGTGVSRTGVYITLDTLLDQYGAEGRVSVFSCVRKMRKDRPAMVRTAKQYLFIYEAIFEGRVAGDTRTGNDLKDIYHSLTRKNPVTGHSYLRDQFKCLQEYTRKLYPSACSNALLPANIQKNRFPDVIPPDKYRPVLVTPGGIGRTDFINAVFLDSHRKRDHYIITQTPLHTTVIDFWKLVYDHDVGTIVMMENYKNEDDTCAQYWPDDNMKQFEPFFVETTDVYQQENITIRNIKLTSMKQPTKWRTVRQFQFNAWSDPEFVPKSKSMLLDVMDVVRDWQMVGDGDRGPVLVHCKDGATHSGLFTAICLLCEKLSADGEVDLFHTVKHLKRRRTQIIDTLDQYRFCYKALWDYMNMRMPGGTLTQKMSQTRSDVPYASLSLSSYISGQSYKP